MLSVEFFPKRKNSVFILCSKNAYVVASFFDALSVLGFRNRFRFPPVGGKKKGRKQEKGGKEKNDRIHCKDSAQNFLRLWWGFLF